MVESDSSRQAIIFVNGDCDESTLSKLPLKTTSVFIAVDGGLRHVKALKRVPDYLIGDMDSIDPADHALLYDNQQTTVIPHPPQKDSTDLELTLAFAGTLGLSSIVLVGVTGGRLDQALGNVLLLGARDWPYDIDIVTDEGDACLLTPERSFRGTLIPGTTVSLLPLSHDVAGVTTAGLYYPLQDARVGFGTSLGISNEVNAEITTVSITRGKLLLVIPRPELVAP